MLMALALTDVLPAFVDYFHKDHSAFPKMKFNQRAWLNTTLLLVLIYLFVESSLFGFQLINTSLSIADREAMSWLQQNTPARAHFLPIKGVLSPEIEPFVEWFLALTERRSQTTIQGLEWLLGRRFYERYADLAEVQVCQDAACLAAWSTWTGLDYEYVVIQNSGDSLGLINLLRSAGGYETVYATKEVLIFSLRRP